MALAFLPPIGGLPLAAYAAVACLMFEGEQHGFRRADTIVRALEAELYFYARVFGFTPAGEIPAVPIDNL